ncbi:MAG: MFS transporter [Pseudomonadota bacterium]
MRSPVADGAEREADKNPIRPLVSLFLVISFTLTIAVTFGFGFYLFPALTTDMQHDIAFSYSSAGLLNAAVQGGFLVGSVLSAVVLARVWGQWVIVTATITSGVALLLTQYVTNAMGLAILFFAFGLAAVMSWIPMVGQVSCHVPERHRGKALTVISSGTSLGVLTNAMIVPYFVTAGDWRDTWTFAGLCTVFIAAVTSIALTLALRSHGRLTGPSGELAQDRATGSDFHRLACSFNVWLVLALCFLNGFAPLAFQSFLSPYLRDELHFSVDFAGGIWMTIAVVGMVSGFIVGTASDRIGVVKTMSGCYALWATSAMIVVAFPLQPMLIFAAIIFALAFYPIYGLVPAYIRRRHGAADSDRIFALGNLMLGLGGLVGNAVGGWVRDLSGSFVPVYLLNVGLCVAAIAVLFISNRERLGRAFGRADYQRRE